MSFEYNRANSRDLGNMNVLVYMRGHVILRVRDTDQVKLTVCMDTYTNVFVFATGNESIPFKKLIS